jgi:hypothetical protein
VLIANVVAQVAIVVTGGLVRLTGSGLGCPTWPQCVPGSYTPVVEQPEGVHKYIEFGNRTLTGVIGIVALAALVAVVLDVQRRSRPRSMLALGAVPLFGVAVQAVLGGITVLTELSPATGGRSLPGVRSDHRSPRPCYRCVPRSTTARPPLLCAASCGLSPGARRSHRRRGGARHRRHRLRAALRGR